MKRIKTTARLFLATMVLAILSSSPQLTLARDVTDNTIAKASSATYSKVALGHNHTCALTTTGGVRCWGYHFGINPADNSFNPSFNGGIPIDITGLSGGVTAIDAGDNHTCALMSDNTVKCWGENSAGELGNNITVDSFTPVSVSGVSGAIAVATGGRTSCVLGTSGTVKCWGEGYGLTPVDVNGLDNDIIMINVGKGPIVCALTTAGIVKCWVPGMQPKETGLTSAATMMSGTYGQLCIVVGLSIECFGEQFFGSNGNLTSFNFLSQSTINGLSGNVTAVTVGINWHACALIIDNTVQCWFFFPTSNRSSGELGNGSLVDSYTPVSVIGLTNITAIDAGAFHTCAVNNTGGVKCWGRNTEGQLGNGSFASSAVPVNVGETIPTTKLLIKPSRLDLSTPNAPSVSQPIRFNAYLNRPIELSLYTQNVSDLGAFTYKASWDPTRAQMQSVSLGALPNSMGRSFNYLPQMPFIDNTLGYARDATYSNNATPAGATGDGDLDLAILTPIATGETLLTLSEAQLAQVNGTVIPINTYNATMVVRASCMGDFDASGKVEINDVQTEAYNYNPAQQVGAPVYDLFYDLDNDTDIDIGDVQKVASRWNKLCSELSTDRVDSRPASKAAKSRMATNPISAKVQASADGNTLIVAAQNLERVGAFEVEMAYNTKTADIVSAELGDALTGSQRQWLALPLRKNPATGKVIFGAVSLGNGDSGLSGAGNLAKINLAALGKTSADAQVLKITLLDVEGNVLATIMPTQASASADK